MFKSMPLKRVLGEVERLENAMKKRKRKFDEEQITNSVET
jgi:hypothetical protein